MKDLFLKGAVKTQLAANRAVDRVREATNSERGDVVQTVIIIGIFVVICVIIGGLLSQALQHQGNELSKCIAGVNTKAGCANFNN